MINARGEIEINIEIANRLLELRKEKGLSQEQLAEQLGISRQAVSKWERAEASPDTDNLIQLAKLYDISLDELLLHKPTKKEEIQDNDEYAHIGYDGIHVKESGGDEVHVSWKGIHVNEKDGHKVEVSKDDIFIDGEEYEKNYFKHHHFPVDVFIFFVILAYAFVSGIWHPTWIFILLIPIFNSLITVFRKRKISCFAYPLFCLMMYLMMGFYCSYWNPGWIVFLTIPCFYSLTHYIESRRA